MSSKSMPALWQACLGMGYQSSNANRRKPFRLGYLRFISRNHFRTAARIASGIGTARATYTAADRFSWRGARPLDALVITVTSPSKTGKGGELTSEGSFCNGRDAHNRHRSCERGEGRSAVTFPIERVDEGPICRLGPQVLGEAAEGQRARFRRWGIGRGATNIVPAARLEGKWTCVLLR